MKTTLSIVLVALLFLSVVLLTASATAQYPAPANGGSIYLDPDYVNGSDVGVGNNFVVELWANISTTAGVPGQEGCFAYAYWFGWNDTLLEIQSYNVYPPADIWTTGVFPVEDVLKDTDFNTKSDTHSYAVTALGNPPGWKDARKIADYTFKVIYEPVSPEPTASCALDITNKGFADADEDLIPMTVYDGLYEFPVAGAPVDTVLDFWFTPNPVPPGDPCELYGTLTEVGGSPVYPASVEVEYSLDGGTTWNYIWTLNTNAAGEFSKTFNAPGAREYLIRVSFGGSPTHNPSSDTETLIVQS